MVVESAAQSLGDSVHEVFVSDLSDSEVRRALRLVRGPGAGAGVGAEG